jgi:AmmeMemoRadiSam system protein A
MSKDPLSPEERGVLLDVARQAIQQAARGAPLPALDLEALPLRLRQPGATFVTLTRRGQLRGCIGALEAKKPLAIDVQEHALAAAFYDYRFPPLSLEEVPEIRIEISYLTPSQPLLYEDPTELAFKIRPGIDGVILREGTRRATFLPQVWDKIPDPEMFLDQLCIKMGHRAGAWRTRPMEVLTYQVEKFVESQGDRGATSYT